MHIPTTPFTVTDWTSIPETRHPGETGHAIWQTITVGDIRIRQVRYSPDYLADHWCDKGHILQVLEGELETELKDGRSHFLKSGMSYQVSDFGDHAHRSSTRTGARILIID
ncbi:MAG: DHCW motif cupin fold protein [Sneathiella sp.]